MDQWKKGEIDSEDGPQYVISAYYRTPSMAGNKHGDGAMSSVTDRQERPERVAIPSKILCHELGRIADIGLENRDPVM
jgi:hypothetical protein